MFYVGIIQSLKKVLLTFNIQPLRDENFKNIPSIHEEICKKRHQRGSFLHYILYNLPTNMLILFLSILNNKHCKFYGSCDLTQQLCKNKYPSPIIKNSAFIEKERYCCYCYFYPRIELIFGIFI